MMNMTDNEQNNWQGKPENLYYNTKTLHHAKRKRKSSKMCIATSQRKRNGV